MMWMLVGFDIIGSFRGGLSVWSKKRCWFATNIAIVCRMVL